MAARAGIGGPGRALRNSGIAAARETNPMDVQELVRLYEEGVTFECGCKEKGLHPSVRKALLDGSVGTVELLYCPEHWAPMVGAVSLPRPGMDPLVFD